MSGELIQGSTDGEDNRGILGMLSNQAEHQSSVLFQARLCRGPLSAHPLLIPANCVEFPTIGPPTRSGTTE